MHLDTFLAQAFIYLLASVIAVPVAKRFGIGSVLGYLLAGIVIGPFVLRLIGHDGGSVMHFAEFGVVMMMFVVGLELKPALLWRLRGPILGMGGAQVVGTAVVIYLAFLAVDWPWKQALATGLILAMSSTAIVLQTLAERGELKTEAGRSSFAVLLFQDIAVIPILAILPLLGTVAIATESQAHGTGHGPELSGWQQALFTLGAVAVIVGGGRYLLRPIFRFIASAKLREVFTATALMLVVGIALLMQSVGLSPALGTFLAGVMLADSEYRHELESDIEPFKGILLGVFFISVGASLDFILIAAEPGKVALGIVALILLKMLVLAVLGRFVKMPGRDISLFSCALAQGGEFCFVLLSIAGSVDALPDDRIKLIAAMVAVSMALTPLLLVIHDRILVPIISRKSRVKKRDMDAIPDEESPVIIAGFGRFGIMVGRMLRNHGINSTVLDLDSDQVDFLRQIGFKLYYGDASRLDLLTAAGAAHAKLFVLAIDDDVKALEIVDTVKKHFPHLTILARAKDRIHAYQLLERKVEHIYRETVGSSLEMAVQALTFLGMSPEEAQEAADCVQELDEKSVRDMAPIWKEHRESQRYIDAARQQLEEMHRLFQGDSQNYPPGAKGHEIPSPKPTGNSSQNLPPKS